MKMIRGTERHKYRRVVATGQQWAACTRNVIIYMVIEYVIHITHKALNLQYRHLCISYSPIMHLAYFVGPSSC